MCKSVINNKLSFSWQREWRRSSSTLSLEEASGLQAVVDHALGERLLSTEGRCFDLRHIYKAYIEAYIQAEVSF